MISVTSEPTLFRNEYMSHIVSRNITWTLMRIIPFEIFEFICTSNFAITLCLDYYCKIRSCISNVCSKCIYLNSLHKCMKRSHVNKIKEIITDLQNNTTKWENVILEKIGKKKHQILSSYEREQPNATFNSWLKRERWTILSI
jgi:hypothetical protein